MANRQLRLRIQNLEEHASTVAQALTAEITDLKYQVKLLTANFNTTISFLRDKVNKLTKIIQIMDELIDRIERELGLV